MTEAPISLQDLRRKIYLKSISPKVRPSFSSTAREYKVRPSAFLGLISGGLKLAVGNGE